MLQRELKVHPTLEHDIVTTGAVKPLVLGELDPRIITGRNQSTATAFSSASTSNVTVHPSSAARFL
jgi:hypothetical protein